LLELATTGTRNEHTILLLKKIVTRRQFPAAVADCAALSPRKTIEVGGACRKVVNFLLPSKLQQLHCRDNATALLIVYTFRLVMGFQRRTGIVCPQGPLTVHTHIAVFARRQLQTPSLLIHRCHVVVSTNLAHAIKKHFTHTHTQKEVLIGSGLYPPDSALIRHGPCHLHPR
jgi:hypothetical protein